MKTLTKTPEKSSISTQQLDGFYFDSWQKPDFLQEVLEGLLDGILILTETGELVHANASASRICCQLNEGIHCSQLIPPAIWKTCQSLIDSRSLFPNQNIILFDGIALNKACIFRIRVRWLELEKFDHPCLLVTIEDRYESLRNVALTESKKYSMTHREAEIWSLYRANYSYKEIAAQLYISLNTVKKHMKNIHAKRQIILATNQE